MANHGKTGTMLEKYRAQKRLKKIKHPSKGLKVRKELRAKAAETLAKALEAEANLAKEKAELAAMEAATS